MLSSTEALGLPDISIQRIVPAILSSTGTNSPHSLPLDPIKNVLPRSSKTPGTFHLFCLIIPNCLGSNFCTSRIQGRPTRNYGDCVASSESAKVTRHKSFAMNFG